jgi:putative transposase
MGWGSLGVASKLRTAHAEYHALGKNKSEREAAYRELFKAHVDGKTLKQIRECVNKDPALGGERFTSQIEALTNRRVTAVKRGRPKVIREGS